MWGELRPAARALAPDAKRAHRRYYCGLCQTLGQGYGMASRALVSYDAVLVALLVDGLQAAPAAGFRSAGDMSTLNCSHQM